MLTLNTITGILNRITIILPIVKFLLFKRFIELDIDDIQVNIGELIKKISIKAKILSGKISKNMQAMGKTNKNGSWKNIHVVSIFIITINSREIPLIW